MLSLLKKYGVKKVWRYLVYYLKKKKGKVVDIYHAFSQMYYPEDIGTTETLTMKSGKRGVYEITNVNGIDDYGSEKITKDFIGYKDVKPIRECSFEEFMALYDGFLK